MEKTVKLIECPRDAMQGWQHFIPTEKKIKYINTLLKIGFDTIDFGSFVSPKAIPQMADTKDVIRNLFRNWEGLVKQNYLPLLQMSGCAGNATEFDEIAYLGFPFSFTPTFQLKNTNSTIEESVCNA